MERVVIGDAALYLGDCIELLASMEAGSVDHVITDPPYEAEAHTKGRRLLGTQRQLKRTVEYGALNFSQINEEIRNRVSALCAKTCRGWFLAFCQAEAVAAWREAHEAGGAKYRRAMVWIKPDGAPQFTGDRPGMGYESIAASWCGSGRSRWNGGGRHGVFTCSQRDGNFPKEHMTQKPLQLMCDLVSLFSNPGETILDPFMGSGTTGIAALRLGRKFIGCELDPRYFEVACKRIEEASKQPDFLIKNPTKQEQAGLAL